MILTFETDKQIQNIKKTLSFLGGVYQKKISNSQDSEKEIGLFLVSIIIKKLFGLNLLKSQSFIHLSYPIHYEKR